MREKAQIQVYKRFLSVEYVGMKKVGIIGWRGMVGSCLMERFETEGDLDLFECHLFSQSLKGETITRYPSASPKVKDSDSLDDLMQMDVLLSCQGAAYTKETLPRLRANNWPGFWLDASSALRMDEDSIIVLDPLNAQSIEKGIESGIKNYAGGNCTVSLMLLAIGGLFQEDLVEWVSGHSYQAASGAGARAMLELMQQSSRLSQNFNDNSALGVLDWEKELRKDALHGKAFPKSVFGESLALSLLPYIDSEMQSGQSKEEWKAGAEASKILNRKVKIDGTCVRVPSLRSHGQALTIKLKKEVSLQALQDLVSSHNEWTKIIPNNKESSVHELNPLKSSGSLDILVGRMRKMELGPEFLNVFTLGDQLLWGAAEPLRRALLMLLKV